MTGNRGSRVSKFILFCIWGIATAVAAPSFAGVVQFKKNQLYVDGEPQPQLWGAEIQYFRLRGGQGKNIPRERVIELWQKALDRAVEARMNAVSFYIPWDFHEYAEGKFDFDGTADEDGDGRPDYPSRDVKTFIKMIKEHGIKHIMVRPGPYINAEWGFLGFGAIPFWFHEKYPQSHCVSPQGEPTSLYSYHSPELLRHSQIWIEHVYNDVIKPFIGRGQPIDFVQIDNETNFMWQSIFNHDYGPRAVSMYQEFLQKKYQTLEALNQAHAREWKAWGDVRPPIVANLNIGEDQDWYRFQDQTIHDYLMAIRRMWENLGIREPQVLFTLAESYNANLEGLLPNFNLKNDRGNTGMITVNLYPKTAGTDFEPLLNQPFKADLDVKSADSASDAYLGQKIEWVLGPEIQGGWWPGTGVSREARQQTYLSTMGHGLKALFIYYFNEGDNWQWDWAREAVKGYYDRLRSEAPYKDIPEDQLPDAFWKQLNDIIHYKISAGWDARHMLKNSTQPMTLAFDSPLGPNAEARPPFNLVRDIGQKVVAPYGYFLGAAQEMVDPVCFLKDSNSHVPSPIPGLNSAAANSDWAGGLVGYMLHAGINPRIEHWGLNSADDLNTCKLIVYQDMGTTDPALVVKFKELLGKGVSVLNFLNDEAGQKIFTGDVRTKNCQPLAANTVGATGYQCQWPEGERGRYYQINEEIYSSFNNNQYANMADVPARRQVLEKILGDLKINPLVKIQGGGDRVVAFGRTNFARSHAWITAKSNRSVPVKQKVTWSEAKEDFYQVKELLTGRQWRLSGSQLRNEGFPLELGAYDSSVFFVIPEILKGK